MKKLTGDTAQQPAADWNANLYETKHAFVWQYGADVVSLLAPQRGERILDLGCGTGQLTAQIADSGAQVLGVDRSPEMISAARNSFPNLKFEIADVCTLSYEAEFDAVFSNATLHWIREPAEVIEGVRKGLRSGGRFVAEFGGKGNIAKIQRVLDRILVEMKFSLPGEVNPWFYPSVSEYASLLENGGMEVRFMTLFDRLTALADGENGMRNWITMFGSEYLSKVKSDSREQFFRQVEEMLRPELFIDGHWWADYRRLRFVAFK